MSRPRPSIPEPLGIDDYISKAVRQLGVGFAIKDLQRDSLRSIAVNHITFVSARPGSDESFLSSVLFSRSLRPAPYTKVDTGRLRSYHAHLPEPTELLPCGKFQEWPLS
jgi:hypothetical protein